MMKKDEKCFLHHVKSYFRFGIRPATLFKVSLRHMCFSVNFAKCLKSTFGRFLLFTVILRILHQDREAVALQLY